MADDEDVPRLYRLLGIRPTATSNEIKKAYHRSALKHHPDKNVDRAEEANAHFKAIVEAYEILRDEDSRAWYDAHPDGMDGEMLVGESVNVRRYFPASCFTGFADGPGGFYAVYTAAFGEVEEEEEKGAKRAKVTYHRPPDFGDSTSEYEHVAEFYDYWLGFASVRTFAEYDEHNPTNEIRYVRRMMEHDNKKIRTAKRKAYNELVRQLVQLVRKRDPRVKAEMERQAADRDARLAEERERQRERLAERLAEAETFQVAGWAAKDEDEIERVMQNIDEFDFDGDDGTTPAKANPLYCAACKKTFKSKKQADNHEKSKKHLEKVGQQRKQREAVDDVRELEAAVDEPDRDEYELEGDELDEDEQGMVKEEEAFFCHACRKPFLSAGQLRNHEKSKKHKDKVAKLRKELEAEDRAFAAMEQAGPSAVPAAASPTAGLSKKEKKRLAKDRRLQQVLDEVAGSVGASSAPPDVGVPAGAAREAEDEDEDEDGDESGDESDSDDAMPLPNSKRGKAKAKREKRKAKQAATAGPAPTHVVHEDVRGDDVAYTCLVCKSAFASRTKLFEHIRATGHAELRDVVDTKKGPKGKKGKKRS